MFVASTFWWSSKPICYSVSFPRLGKNRIWGGEWSLDKLSQKGSIRESHSTQNPAWCSLSLRCLQSKNRQDKQHRHYHEDKPVPPNKLPFPLLLWLSPRWDGNDQQPHAALLPGEEKMLGGVQWCHLTHKFQYLQNIWWAEVRFTKQKSVKCSLLNNKKMLHSRAPRSCTWFISVYLIFKNTKY